LGHLGEDNATVLNRWYGHDIIQHSMAIIFQGWYGHHRWLSSQCIGLRQSFGIRWSYKKNLRDVPRQQMKNHSYSYWANWIFQRSRSRFSNRDSRMLGTVTCVRGTITRELGAITWRAYSHTCKAIEIELTAAITMAALFINYLSDQSLQIIALGNRLIA